MYHNSDYYMRKANNDERIIGKVNLWQGVIAAVVVLGILSVVLSLSYEMPILAVICGVVAVAILVLVIADPVGILRRKTRNDEADNQKE